MLIGEIRMDVSRYTTRFGDRTISKVTDGDESFWLTEKGRVLVTQPKLYECSGESSDNGKTFDMVKYIVSNGNVTPARYFENIWNSGNYDIGEIAKLYEKVDCGIDIPINLSEAVKYVDKVEYLMPLLKGE